MGTATGTPSAASHGGATATSDDVREMQHHLDLLLTESDLMREQEAVFRSGKNALSCQEIKSVHVCTRHLANAF